ncbi:unnamed protein product [marine sediment metagenome]|uniref:Uncharacterized protein n=1 Tax=marine sediment metagenome TaxID=412755 RepID=X0SWA9_9ZZZZ
MNNDTLRNNEKEEIERLKELTYTEINERINELKTKLNNSENELNNLRLGDVSGTVWVVQDTMSGMIAGVFDSQIKAIKYTDKSKGMAIINMEVI